MTRDSSKKRNFPPMDTLAVYRDGSMKVRICDELTAEQYLEDGAVQVFSFGPWLIRDGKANEDVLHPKKNDIMKNNNPRAVMGMVEPFHYILMVVGVPNENKYAGVSGEWLIGKLLEYGCTEALNLDGGGTACMVFNGKTIIQGRWSKEKRVLGSMIAFGLPEAAGEADE
jgi:exopolysaccharide biosynthesis protein